MPAGLQIWNASGALILDATQRCGRVLSIQQLTGGVSNSYTDSRLSQGTPFVAYQRDKTCHLSYGYGGIQSPVISISGNTVTWTYSALNASYDEYAAGLLVIGVY
jgi:hypothetical protein